MVVWLAREFLTFYLDKKNREGQKSILSSDQTNSVIYDFIITKTNRKKGYKNWNVNISECKKW